MRFIIEIGRSCRSIDQDTSMRVDDRQQDKMIKNSKKEKKILAPGPAGKNVHGH